MAREERILYGVKGYSSWSIRRTISEAENIARWKPWIAHKLMEEARNAITLDAPFYKEFDEACARINARWKNKEQYNWFNVVEFWKIDKQVMQPCYLEDSQGEIHFDETLFLTNQI